MKLKIYILLFSFKSHALKRRTQVVVFAKQYFMRVPNNHAIRNRRWQVKFTDEGGVYAISRCIE